MQRNNSSSTAVFVNVYLQSLSMGEA